MAGKQTFVFEVGGRLASATGANVKEAQASLPMTILLDAMRRVSQANDNAGKRGRPVRLPQYRLKVRGRPSWVAWNPV